MKKIYTLILSLCTLCTYAQEFSWARQAGLYAYDYGYGVGTDAAGNVYVAGKYEEDANFECNRSLSLAKQTIKQACVRTYH